FSTEGTILKQPLDGEASFNPKRYMKDSFTSKSLESLETPEGVLVYQDLSIIKDQPFIRVAISIPNSIMLKDTKDALRFSLIFLLIFTFIIVLIIYYQAKHFTRPIVKLSAAASELAMGSLAAKVDVKASGEVKMLVDSFNQMAKDLKQSRIKIVQRSEDLDAANEELAASNEELAATNEELNSINENLEQRVDERTRELQDAQTIAHVGSWRWNIKSGELQWSDETYRIFGLKPREIRITYQDFLSYIHPADKEKVKRSIENSLYNGQPYNIEHRIILQGGDEKLVIEKGQVNYNEGMPVKMVGVIQDITDRKRAEAEKEELWGQLLQSQKMETIGLFSGRVAHDFNNMLTPIVGYSTLAFEMLPEGNKAREMVERIHNTSIKASRLIDQLLTFSRKQVFKMSSCGLNHIIIEMRSLLSSLLGEGTKLIIEADSRTSNIIGNLTNIQQIIINLVANASQAMPNGGTLTIGVKNVEIDDAKIKTNQEAVKGEYVELSVSDTGSGMSQEVQSKIFDPFFTTRSTEKGSGLGLSTVYGIVKQHNGFIDINSALKKGTTFKIYFPVMSILDTEEEESLEFEETIDTNGTETILVVDDRAIIHKMIGEILRPKGYTVLEAEGAEQAMQKLVSYEGDDIALLVTDVVMPEVNGWDLFQNIKTIKPDIKVLFTSGFVENPIVLNKIQENGFPFIKKPL
ncbi:ATP-binding protein, partial [Thermodesulfobacteriota bacterium]